LCFQSEILRNSKSCCLKSCLVRFEIQTMNCEGINQWREFFKGATGSIFQVINMPSQWQQKITLKSSNSEGARLLRQSTNPLLSLRCGHGHNELTRPEKAKQESFIVLIDLFWFDAVRGRTVWITEEATIDGSVCWDSAGLNLEKSVFGLFILHVITEYVWIFGSAIIYCIQMKHLSHSYETFVMLYMV